MGKYIKKGWNPKSTGKRFKKGQIPWNKGKEHKWGYHDSEAKYKISKANKGIKKPWLVERNKSKKMRDIVSKTHKGKIPWNKGVPCTGERKENIRNALKGKSHDWNKGVPHSEETKRKMSDAQKGKPKPYMIKLNRDPEFIKKKLRGLIKRPTKPEKVLFELIQQNNFPYKYVGDGKIIIKYFNPDFINCNGQKKVIEMFGDYWHNREDAKKRDKLRLKAYSDYGYETLIIWEHELKNTDKVIEKIKSFERGDYFG